MNEQLIKSKHRVKQHGEVFTPQWMVDMMLDVPGVKEACESTDATFLEPAAGDGNFLVAIVERKLRSLSTLNFNEVTAKRESLWVLASVYGIELLQDNHTLAQERVLLAYSNWWENYFGEALEEDNDYWRSAEFIVSKNIVRGNTLTQKHPETGKPITFYEWVRQEDPDLAGYKNFRFQDILKEKKQGSLLDENLNIQLEEELKVSRIRSIYQEESK